MKKTLLLAGFLCILLSVNAQTTIVSLGSTWKYSDRGNISGSTWRSASYNDGAWKTGAAQLGYGDGDEATVVSYGTNANKKYITTYFRKLVSISNPSSYTNFTLGIKRDDGAVVYINGTERFRTNMPTGSVSGNTKASTAASDDGNTIQTINLASSLFINGNNIIAVEVHQFSTSDPDLSFDLQLIANPVVNQPPVANAGTDQSITLPTNSATLSGSGSDPNGTISAYVWSQVSGPSTATISNPSSASTSVSNLVQGSYTFRLTVTDNNGATASDDAVITVNAAVNQPPTANAGADQAITLPANSATLSGSGSDPDGTISSYAWSQVSGPSTATISNPSSASTSVSNLVQGSYTFRLTVTDNNGATASDDVVITVNTAVNQPPTANAGADQAITLPANSATLSGSGSDPDGTISTYAWSQVSGPSTATISNPSSASTSVSNLVQGNYTFHLTVTDNNGATASDDVIVSVNPITSYNVISFGGTWKYLDNGSDQGTGWRSSGFNDAAWASGPGQLGYGDGDEATTLSFGPSSTAKYITSYFRKTVSINSPSSYGSFTLNVKRDDGIVVYVNGTEVYRNNMPTGTVAYTTLASTAASDDGSGIQTTSLATSVFADGSNTIAVEIHQNAGSSSDISFDMELKANAPGVVNLLRGPYLQMGNGNAATLRWYTDAPTDSKIEAGTVHGIYTSSAVNAAVSTLHEVRITGLLPDTKYYYRFGSSTSVLQASTDNFFRTAPPANTSRKFGIAVFGDCGRNDNNYQTGTLNAYRNYVGSNPADIMLLLGDNAYNSGTEAEYTSNFFNVYSGNILKNHMLFPAPGNHDYANSSTRQADHAVPYYDIFTMPAAAECGGVASGTEAFYSYDWGNIHFLSLDSYGWETGNTRLYDTLGPQVTWIKNDLNANNKKWTIAYWHHPPYTMGSHNSDTESDLVSMRQRFIRILERYGVDLILCGHSHDYERSYLLKGYYGNEASFDINTHAISGSSAKYDGSANSCPYNTPSGKTDHGTVYVVAGSAGASGGVQAGYPHNALPFAQNDGGMLYLEVEDSRLDAKFIRKDGVIADKFTIMKDAAKSNNYTIHAGESVTLSASWIGNYSWSTGATTRSITVSPAASTNYSCNDGSTACITDNFSVTVNPLPKAAVSYEMKDQGIIAYPVPVRQGEILTIRSGSEKPVQLSLINDKGQKIRDMEIRNEGRISTTGWHPGVYFIRKAGDTKAPAKKIIVTY